MMKKTAQRKKVPSKKTSQGTRAPAARKKTKGKKPPSSKGMLFLSFIFLMVFVVSYFQWHRAHHPSTQSFLSKLTTHTHTPSKIKPQFQFYSEMPKEDGSISNKTAKST